MKDSNEHIITLDYSIAKTVQHAKQKLRINARTQELLHEDGQSYDYCPEKAREQATSEVLGVLAK